MRDNIKNLSKLHTYVAMFENFKVENELIIKAEKERKKVSTAYIKYFHI